MTATPEQKAAKAAYMRSYMNDPAHPERRVKNTERRRDAYRNLDPEQKEAWKKRTKSNHVEKRHGITLEERDEMLAQQDFRCACCGDPLTARFCMDHDHTCCPGGFSCGKCLRGILCDNCNWGLGQFKDSAERLRMAIAYLERY